MKRKIQLIMFISIMLFLTGCSSSKPLTTKDLTIGNLIDYLTNIEITIFDINVGNNNDEKDVTEPIYSEYDKSETYKKVNEVDERFDHHITKYKHLVDDLWDKEGYYKKSETEDVELTERELLIDFYLFMEYHKDAQRRNLQFPEGIQGELLLIESLFAKKSIDYIANKDFTEYKSLRDDLVKLYRDMYREEMINILFEGYDQVIIRDRIPNIINRYNEEIENSGLKDRLRHYLGIPDSLISRGMGLDLITLYSEMGYLPEGDIKKLALLLTTEMKISGINMRLENFFYITNSLEGMDIEIEELRKDVDIVTVNDNMEWIRTRMNRSLNHLEELYLYYKGDKEFDDISDIFIDLQTREDFYAISLLSKNIKDIMDKENYWDDLDRIKKELEELRKEEQTEYVY